MLQVLLEYLKNKGWSFAESKEKGVVIFNLTGKNGTIPCVADVKHKNRFIFLTFCTANCPDSKKSIVAELLMRLNFYVYYGTFEMNYDTGEIRFKTSIPTDHLEPTQEIIEDIVMSNVPIMDDCLPAILKLMYSPDVAALDIYNNLIESATKSN